MTHPDPMISCQNISVSLGDKVILDDISFHIPSGSITSLLGVSGSGKSTLLRYMSGLTAGYAGMMRLRGKETNKNHDIILSPAARNIAYMFQDYALFPHKTVLGNVLFADTTSNSKADKQEEAKHILGEVGLSDHLTRYPHQLSGGEKQRLALARCLMQKTDLVFLDEPFSNLDARLRDHLRDEVLTLLRQKGKTIIMVTHDPAEAMLVSDQILYMREHKIIQSGSPEELYLAPSDYETALFFGAMNQIQGNVTHKGLETPLGIFPVQDITTKEAVLCLRHEAFEIAQGDTALLKGTLKTKSFSGAFYICDIAIGCSAKAEYPIKTQMGVCVLHERSSCIHKDLSHRISPSKKNNDNHLYPFAEVPIGDIILTANLPMSALSGYKVGQNLYLNIKPEGLFVFPVKK